MAVLVLVIFAQFSHCLSFFREPKDGVVTEAIFTAKFLDDFSVNEPMLIIN